MPKPRPLGYAAGQHIDAARMNLAEIRRLTRALIRGNQTAEVRALTYAQIAAAAGEADAELIEIRINAKLPADNREHAGQTN